VYGTGINLAPVGYATANFSNGGERVTLLGPFGETLQDFTYDDIAPWPMSPDGNGPSLEIIDPLGDPANAANWRASAHIGGSPGTDGVLVIGDYDRNGTVEQADYGSWTARFGMAVTPGMGADGNQDGTVNSADYVLWRKALESPQGAAAFALPSQGPAENQNATTFPETNVSSRIQMTWTPEISSTPVAAASAQTGRSDALPLSFGWASTPRVKSPTIDIPPNVVPIDPSLARRLHQLADSAYAASDNVPLPAAVGESKIDSPSAEESKGNLDMEIWENESWLHMNSWRRW
jgi:hypothetical protein